jgi:penicillin-binding protein 1A
MQKVLKGTPEKPLETPEGVVSLRINAESGLRDDSSSLSEWFFAESTPRGREDALGPAVGGRTGPDVRDQLF